MFEKLGSLIVTRKKFIFTLFIALILAAGAIGSSVFGKLDSGGYSDPKSDSAKVFEYLTDEFKVKDPAVVLVVETKNGIISPEASASATRLESQIKLEPGVESTLSFWSSGGAPSLKSSDGNSAFLFIYSKSIEWDEVQNLGKRMQEKYEGNYETLRVYASGTGVFAHAINTKIADDLKISEAISIPLTFIFLVFVFGSLVASAMPLLVGASAILGSLLIMYLLTLFTGVSVFALNLITGLGLGLGIDYSLLIVNRFREELHAGKSVEDAVRKTVSTAGKTVFYSGLTIVITLASLMLFPLMFLKSFGYAGVTVVIMAVLGSLVALPALLAILGTRINKAVVRKGAIAPKEDGRWAQTARFVMRRPVAVVTLSLILLTVLAAPIKDIVFTQVDSRVLPASNPAAAASQIISERFPGQEGNPIEIVVPNGAQITNQIDQFTSEVAKVDGIVRIGQLQSYGNDVRVTAIHEMSPRTPDAERLINEIRDLQSPTGTLIGGVAADYADTQNGIARTMPWALLWIVIGVLLLLFVFTGSIILPIKAVILNILSLAATLGAITWIFVHGNLQWLVGEFTVTNAVDTGSIILVAVVAFGLSMDYELFLLSRIKEEHDAGKSNIESVAIGLQRSARIITAAAGLLAIVFASFMLSGVTSIKMLGFGVAFAIILDATLVRALLVPALMRLFGERNWWAPKSMKKFTISH
ncbi:MAG: multidrug RND transporter [Actinobacteria bacterium BACL4 MAG-121001-bin59]|jgi:putative drug exporter of the RND superfamily|uniref:MMPL family transporter n=1 Tax=Candidatus Nanopelagicus sp. TaxID=2518620 RepID=UPI00071623E8|nr:MAG: multidrug RND transporter [Actinobacteria bacterium BACL4 MAG-121001-bin59]